jgi:hypothetical protein
MDRLDRGIDVIAFRNPAIVLEMLDCQTEAAGDIQKAAFSATLVQPREHLPRPICADSGNPATLDPVRGFICYAFATALPDLFKRRNIRLVGGRGVAAVFAEEPLIVGIVTPLGQDRISLGTPVEGNGYHRPGAADDACHSGSLQYRQKGGTLPLEVRLL